MFFKKKDKAIKAYANGKMIPITQVEDQVFSQKIMGDGLAIFPDDNKIYAPCDGQISAVFEQTQHAVGITLKNGIELILHVGLDTVKLGGRGFDVKVEEGAKIKKGDLLMTFDLSAIKKSGYKVTTPIVVCNSDEFHAVEIIARGDVNAGDAVMKIVK